MKMAAMARLNRIWQNNTTSFTSKFKLNKSLVTSILLCGCDTWTLHADSETKDPGFWNKVPEETSQHLLLEAQDNQEQLGVEQDQHPCGPTETSSGNCQETETRMVWANHTPWETLKNYWSGHFGGWVMLWLAEKMLDGQHQRVDTLIHAWTAHNGPLQKRLEKDLCWSIYHVPWQPNRLKDWTVQGNWIHLIFFATNLLTMHLQSSVNNENNKRHITNDD